VLADGATAGRAIPAATDLAGALGGIVFAFAALRSGQGRLPDGLEFSAVVAVTPLKGIGFTVAIFISTLALDTPALQDEAKLAILIGSVTAATIGIAALLAHGQRSASRARD
jgi:NhaA family Na+:H+ antiporter